MNTRHDSSLKVDERRDKGAYYTSDFIAEYMTKFVKDLLTVEEPKVLEPSCGDGVFLKYLDNITAIDIDEDAAKIAKRNNPHAEVFSGCFFKAKFEDKFDLIIGNPPYVQKPKRLYNTAKFGNNFGNGKVPNLGYQFLSRILDLVNPDGGVVSLVLSSFFIESDQAKGFLNYLNKVCRQYYIVDLGSGIFPGVRIRTYILTCVLGKSERCEVYVGDIDNNFKQAVELKPLKIGDFIHVTKCDRKVLDNCILVTRLGFRDVFTRIDYTEFSKARYNFYINLDLREMCFKPLKEPYKSKSFVELSYFLIGWDRPFIYSEEGFKECVERGRAILYEALGADHPKVKRLEGIK